MRAFFTKEQIDGMVRDARNVEASIDHGVREWHGPAVQLVGDLCCHVKALASFVEELRASNAALAKGETREDFETACCKSLNGGK